MAVHLGISRARLSRVLAGLSRVTADMALCLEWATGITAECWLRMQADYDLAQARLSPPRTIRRLLRGPE